VRIHAIATQSAAQRIGQELGQPMTGSLATAALLHDVGKVVLAHAYGDYEGLSAVPATPDERFRLEREAFGIDHAVAGAAALRRLGLPVELAAAVERHHSPDASGDGALIRVADMLAHYAAGAPVDPRELSSAASAVGLGDDALRNLLGAPTAGEAAVRRTEVDPPPVSGRQLQILGLLREGKTYKQIAAELELSASTVRNHLHLVFGRLGVVDRAQAVLLASERGWI
jgi:putative nucleotidyltransferase with HDIG domain